MYWPVEQWQVTMKTNMNIKLMEISMSNNQEIMRAMEAIIQQTQQQISWLLKVRWTQWVEGFQFQQFYLSETQTQSWHHTSQRRSYANSTTRITNTMDMGLRWRCSRKYLVVDNKGNLWLKKKVITVRGLVKMRAIQWVDLLEEYQVPSNSEQMQQRTSKYLSNKITTFTTTKWWCETKQTNQELTILRTTALVHKVENITLLLVLVHSLQIVIFHQSVNETVLKTQMISVGKTITIS